MTDIVAMLGWPLMACLAMLGILGYLGIHVLKREIIFIDIAVAQITAVGATWAHLQFHAHKDSLLYYATGLGFALVAAAFYSFARKKVVQVPLEAVIGVSYAVAAAGFLFLPGIFKHAHIHVQDMLGGSILYVDGWNVFKCAFVFAIVGLLFALFRRPLGRISDDYQSATREGLAVGRWDFLFYTLVGVVITMAVRVGGVVLVFAFLIIPATTSALFCARWATRLSVAWATGLVASILGLLFALHLDFSIGPAVALFLGVGLILAAVLRGCRLWIGVPAAAAFVVVYVGLIAAHPPAIESAPGAEPECCPEPIPPPPEAPPDESLLTEKEIRRRLARAENAVEFESLYRKSTDDALRGEIVCRTLEVNPPIGASIAIDFLGTDPPIFFRQGVVDALSEVMAVELKYDVMEDFLAPGNQETISRVRTKYELFE